MSDEEDSYCRLCAEPTGKSQLIAPDDDVGLNSKIAMKMLWINIDVSSANTLPNSICFACFDSLERTWTFLHNVRTAQNKLNEIYLKKDVREQTSSDIKTDPDIPIKSDCEENSLADMRIDTNVTGKPINEDWEIFDAMKQEVKPEILNEELQIVTVDPSTLLDMEALKAERDSDDYNPESDGMISTDSDVPLYTATKKKKNKKKKKSKYKSEHSILNDSEARSSQTWEEYMCLCADCDAQCKNIMSLRLHSLQIHNRCCLFKCSDCGKVISNNKTFVNHVKSHNKLLRFCCDICNKCFTSTTTLKTHRDTVHRISNALTCHNCGSMFENSEQLNDHVILYTRKFRKRNLHENLDATKGLKCEHCNKEFKSQNNLRQHKTIHKERSRNFSCHVCGKMFFTKGTLGTHMMIHDDSRPFKCEFCPLSFHARGNLNSHISLHSGAKPFVCEQCGKSFRVKRHLKSHSITHTDLRPYECNYCNKTFRFKTRLNLHLRQHTGAKPYKCDYCQRDFTNGSNYKKHMKRKHNIDTSTRRKYSSLTGNPNVVKTDMETNQE